ncbi:MAG: aminoglycoside phosphotransferase family protein [Gammaproteobacteria bacterium]|nr:aminoglycoside phosphotransferase family protein [Gammaproteobacteria bacterium]
MKRMHKNELQITEPLVRSLLCAQCPEWAELEIEPVPSSGTDHALFRVGKNLVARLPRIERAVKNIDKEYEWVPEISKLIKTSVSIPIFKGERQIDYPYQWLILKWNEGVNPNFEKENEYAELAKELANFLNQLHGINLKNGPQSRRGIPLINQNIKTQKAINQLTLEINVKKITALWKQLSCLPSWNKPSVWVHGDFLPGNILVKQNNLNAVIDFSDLGIGDPACDLIIAWSLFNEKSRNIFKNNLNYIDADTWLRGQGWALSIALIMLPYYKKSNPQLAKLAKRVIKSVL